MVFKKHSRPDLGTPAWRAFDLVSEMCTARPCLVLLRGQLAGVPVGGHAGHGDARVVRHRHGLGGHLGDHQRLADHDQVDPLSAAVEQRLVHARLRDRVAFVASQAAERAVDDGALVDELLVLVLAGPALEPTGHETGHLDGVPGRVRGLRNLDPGVRQGPELLTDIGLERVARRQPDDVRRPVGGRRLDVHRRLGVGDVRPGPVGHVRRTGTRQYTDDQDPGQQPGEPAAPAATALGRRGGRRNRRGRGNRRGSRGNDGGSGGIRHAVTSWRQLAYEELLRYALGEIPSQSD